MGAWNYTVFDDDTTYDALDDLRASADIVADIEKYFDTVIEADYVEYDEAHYALVSAAIMDSAVNGTPYRCDDEGYFEWAKTLNDIGFSIVKPKVVKAIDAVLSDHSELKELWEENEALYTSWREDKLAMQKNLMQQK